MAPTPSRRRKTARTARSVALLQAGLALAGSRSSRRRRRSGPGRLIAALGLVAAGAVGVLGRDRIAGLLPGRSADASAPSTSVPPQPAIDERAEEQAAAAEAGAIGGTTGGSAALSGDVPAGEEQRPVVEAGGGEAEDQEQAEGQLAADALLRDQPTSDADMDPASGEGGGISGRPGARLDDVAETPGVPPTGSPATEPQTGDGDNEERGGGETWSGRPA